MDINAIGDVHVVYEKVICLSYEMIEGNTQNLKQLGQFGNGIELCN